MKEERIDELLREKLSNFEKAPSAGTFAKIQQRMHPPKKKSRFVLLLPLLLKYGVAASVAFVMGMGSMYMYNNSQENGSSTIAVSSENMDNTTNETTNLASNPENILVSDNDAINSNAINEAATNNVNSNPNTNTSTSFASNTVNSNTGTSTNSNNKANTQRNKEYDFQSPIASNNHSIQEQLTVYSLYSFQNEIDDGKRLVKVNDEYYNTRFQSNGDHIGYKGFWFGPQLNISTRSFSNLTMFGSGLGFNFGYDINNKFGLQTGASYNMMFRELKTFDTDGNQIQETLDLSSIDIPLAIKFKKSYFAAKMERPVSFNTYVGMDYSRLGSLGKNQLGAHLGIEYDIFLKQEMLVSVGVRAGMSSILDYSPTQTYLQADYKKYNYNVGLYTAIRFIVPRK